MIWVTEPATGTALAAYEYDGYGQITQTQGTLSQPYGYTGREYDAESGLYHYRARAYDPAVGLFVQSDPIEMEAGSLTFYGYVDQNPLTWSDPSGLTAAIECQGGQVTGGACGTMAGVTAGALIGIRSLGHRLAMQLARQAVFSMAHDDATGEEHVGKESRACREAEERLDKAQQRSKGLGGGCNKLTKTQKKLFATPQMQTMLFARLWALQDIWQARQVHDQVCHGGPDPDHEKQYTGMRNAVVNCENALKGKFK